MQIKWHTEKRKIGELIPYENNPRQLSEKQYQDLKRSLSKFNLAEIPAINTDMKIIAGHQRLKVLSEIYGKDYEIDVRVPNRELTKKEFEEYNIRSNKNSGEWDFDVLANEFDLGDLKEWGFDNIDLKMLDNDIEDPVFEDKTHIITFKIYIQSEDADDYQSELEKLRSNFPTMIIQRI